MPETPARSALRAKARAVGRRAVLALPAARRLQDERADLRARLRRSQRHERQLQAELDTLRGDVAAHRAGLDQPVTQALQYLFIVTYGRSGSTLLMGILDSTPGYLVRGENDDAVYQLFQFHSRLVAARKRWSTSGESKPNDAWYGIDQYTEDAAVAGMRHFVLRTLLRPGPDTRFTGFKEIRWWQKDWQEYLDFLRLLFPGARFVINVRDHEAVARSKWWVTNTDALKRLEEYEERLDAIADYLGDLVYRVNFDEFVADPDVLRGLFDWLGEPFDRERVDATMRIKHSS